jgi:hypothetical protein
MTAPPPIPRKGSSPFLLIALVFVLVAVAIHVFANREPEQPAAAPLTQLAIAVAGLVSGALALAVSLGALIGPGRTVQFHNLEWRAVPNPPVTANAPTESAPPK